MQHRVHIYATVRCPFDTIEAESHEQAVELALEKFERNANSYVASGEYADEVTAALVDEDGDPEFEKSTTHELAPAMIAAKAIQELMSGQEWNSDTLGRIAAIMKENGFELKDLGE